jgi:hypothetical protein
VIAVALVAAEGDDVPGGQAMLSPEARAVSVCPALVDGYLELGFVVRHRTNVGARERPDAGVLDQLESGALAHGPWSQSRRVIWTWHCDRELTRARTAALRSRLATLEQALAVRARYRGLGGPRRS